MKKQVAGVLSLFALFCFVSACSLHVVDVLVTNISMRQPLPVKGAGVSVSHTKLGVKSWIDLSVECVSVV